MESSSMINESADKPANKTVSNKNVIVTGGAGILGRNFCEAFLEAGATVACYDLGSTENKYWAESLRKKNSRFHWFECDLKTEDSISNAVQLTYEAIGRVDVVLNNAASKGPDLKRFFDSVEEFSLDIWKDITSVNVDAMFLMAKYVGKKMKEQKIQGSFIQIASIYGVVAPDQRIYEGSKYLGHEINTPLVYSTTKAAVLGLTKYLASYWGPAGIRCNAISPGGVESGQNTVFTQKYSARVPLGRMAAPKDLTSAAVFLASDDSAYINGHNLVIDGGLSVW